MFNDKLKKLREEKEMTQKELADHLYVTRSAVAKWEQGRGIPNPESMKLLSSFFDVDEKELMNREETMEVLYHFEQTSNKERTKAIITLSLLILGVIIFFVSLAIKRYNMTEREIDNTFFSSKVLKEYSLMNLEEVDVQGESFYTSMDKYYAQVSDDFDMKAYASYVLDYLLDSPYISFVGFDIGRTTETYTGTDMRYIARSEHIEDYKEGLSYIFYYLDDLDPDRLIQSEVNFKKVSILFFGSQGYIGFEEKQFNFSMSLRESKNDIYQYYFFEEYYNPLILTIHNENISDYFDIEIFYESYYDDYFAVAFQYNQYFIHANIQIDLVVKYGTEIFNGTLNIKKGYDWSTYYFFHTDTSGWDIELIEIVSYDVIYGEMWII